MDNYGILQFQDWERQHFDYCETELNVPLQEDTIEGILSKYLSCERRLSEIGPFIYTNWRTDTGRVAIRRMEEYRSAVIAYFKGLRQGRNSGQ